MPQPRQLAAIVFTDIVGYTALMGSDEERALSILRKSREIQKTATAKYDGKWLKEMGDGVLTQFTSALDSVQCALEIQKRAINELEASIRIGIHVGDVTIENEDVFGDGVNIASRLQSIADPGGIYISESVHKAIRARSDIESLFIGEVKLKNVGYPVKTYALTGEDLPQPSPAKIKELLPGRNKVSKSVLISLLAIVALAFWWFLRPDMPSESLHTASLAVLPFDNLMSDAANDYLVDGIHDALIGKLGQVAGLRVISRQSTLQFKEKSQSITEIANILGVTNIVEGSVYGYGDSVRVQVQLIEAFPQERHVWAQEYRHQLGGIFSILGDATYQIAETISSVFDAPQTEIQGNASNVNPDIYKAYLKGMYYLNKSSREDLQTGLDYLHEAIGLDPGDAQAYAGLATGYALLGHDLLDYEKAWQRAKAAAERAITLDPSIAEGHAVLAAIKLYFENDWEGAEEAFLKANQLNPNLSMNHYHYAWYLMMVGRTDESVKEHVLAQELDPLNTKINADLGQLYSWLGRYDEALKEINMTLEQDKNYAWAYWALGNLYVYTGKYDEAIRAHKRAVEITPMWTFALGSTYAQAGMNEEAQEIVNTLEALKPNSARAFGLAMLYTVMGDNERAFEWLSFKPPHAWVPWIRVWPEFKVLKDDPRYNKMMAELNLPE